MSIPTTIEPYTVGGTGDPFGGGGYVDPILTQTVAGGGGTGGTGTVDPALLQTVAGGGTGGTVDPTLLQGSGGNTDTSNQSWVQTNPIANTPTISSQNVTTGQVGGRVFTQDEIDMYNSMGATDAQMAVTNGLLTFDEWYGIQNGLIQAGQPANVAGTGQQDNPIRPGSYFADAQIWDVGGENDPFTNPGAGPQNYQQYYQNMADSDAAYYAYLESRGELDAYWESMYGDALDLLTGGDTAPPVQQGLPPQQIDPRWLQEQNLTGSYASAMGNAGQMGQGLQSYYATPQQQQQQQVLQQTMAPQQIQPLYYY